MLRGESEKESGFVRLFNRRRLALSGGFSYVCRRGRIIYFFHNERVPVFLLAVFAKHDRANLTQAETNMLGNAAKMLARKYGE